MLEKPLKPTLMVLFACICWVVEPLPHKVILVEAVRGLSQLRWEQCKIVVTIGRTEITVGGRVIETVHSVINSYVINKRSRTDIGISVIRSS